MPAWIDPKVSVGNILTIAGIVFAAIIGYATLSNDNATAREDLRRMSVEIERLKARDEAILERLTIMQRETIQTLTRVETQLNLLLQERRSNASPR